jgi:adenine/guanine phosphoribosyltransferase-like PRPP-binding protein
METHPMTRAPYRAALFTGELADLPQAPFTETYPVALCDGSYLELPIEPLPGTDQAIVLLMSNQTPFEVEQKLASLLSGVAKEFSPEIIVGIPTLGLDYARLAASQLGFPHYVALGNSRKFWYQDELSVPVFSITSPGVAKRLYLDPSLLTRVAGKRTLIVDDVIATGGSAFAAITLLQKAGADVVGLAAVLNEGQPWREVLAGFGADWPDRVRTVGEIPRLVRCDGGWIPLAA